MLKMSLAKSRLYERTIDYWRAMKSWNGKGESLSAKKMNDLYQGALDHNRQHDKVYKLCLAGIELIIKHGRKPKRVRARKDCVFNLEEVREKKQATAKAKVGEVNG